MTAVAAPLTHAKRGRGEPGLDWGHEALATGEDGLALRVVNVSPCD
jgi:hypothetical protein